MIFVVYRKDFRDINGNIKVIPHVQEHHQFIPNDRVHDLFYHVLHNSFYENIDIDISEVYKQKYVGFELNNHFYNKIIFVNDKFDGTYKYPEIDLAINRYKSTLRDLKINELLNDTTKTTS
jgi:hypothetical protein